MHAGPEACTANPDECQVDRVSDSERNEDGCDENAECHDTDGSYPPCQCRPGFTGDGYNCTGVLRNLYKHRILPLVFSLSPEVSVCNNVTCSDDNAHCVNSVGNYSCQCNPGFTGDGYNCSGKLCLVMDVISYYVL